MSKHLMAKMRRSAGEDDVRIPPDMPHDDWRPKYRDSAIEKWHPAYGETHVKYHIWRAGGGRNPIIWGANHHGICQGDETIDPPSGDYGSITLPKYSLGDEPEQLGRFKKPEQAKAAAEEHFAETYGKQSKPGADYYEQVMGDLPDPDEGFDIFGDGGGR